MAAKKNGFTELSKLAINFVQGKTPAKRTALPAWPKPGLPENIRKDESFCQPKITANSNMQGQAASVQKVQAAPVPGPAAKPVINTAVQTAIKPAAQTAAAAQAAQNPAAKHIHNPANTANAQFSNFLYNKPASAPPPRQPQLPLQQQKKTPSAYQQAYHSGQPAAGGAAADSSHPKGQTGTRNYKTVSKQGTAIIVFAMCIFFACYQWRNYNFANNPLITNAETAAQKRYKEMPFEITEPAKGSGNLLSMPEIRWCLSEDLRLEEQRLHLDTEQQISTYNTEIRNYNSRCADFQYKTGDMQKAQEEIETVKDKILEEIKKGETGKTLAGLSARQIIQMKHLLDSFGYAPGIINEKYTPEMKAAIKKFQKETGQNDDGMPSIKLLNMMQTLYNDLIGWMETGRQPQWMPD